jgi:hypothetical protein
MPHGHLPASESYSLILTAMSFFFFRAERRCVHGVGKFLFIDQGGRIEVVERRAGDQSACLRLPNEPLGPALRALHVKAASELR